MLKTKIVSGLLAVSVLLALLLAACGESPAAPGNQTQDLVIDTTSLPEGQAGIVYSYTLQASGGSGNYTWSVSAGSLPDGFTLLTNSGGINGNSSNPGTYSFTVRVSDGTASAEQPLSITIKPTVMPLFIGNTYFDAGEVDVPYTRSLSASGGSGSYTWTIPSGSLPDGLTFDGAKGIITGTPQKDGTFYFTLQVTDTAGTARSSNLSITIKPYITISTPSLPDGKVGTGYDRMLEYDGAVGNVTWSIAAGSLPAGLTLDSFYGEISGKPETAGVFNFTVKAVDKLGAEVTGDFSITIVP